MDDKWINEQLQAIEAAQRKIEQGKDLLLSMTCHLLQDVWDYLDSIRGFDKLTISRLMARIDAQEAEMVKEIHLRDKDFKPRTEPWPYEHEEDEMPLKKKGKKIMKAMRKTYKDPKKAKKAKKVFYASKAAGKIKGVD